MIVGTAGHIDHGKSSLVKALTGVDPDRLKEEKARGITIDLGYAYQPLDGGRIIGFIDVPGHERLIHTMLAGATGIDLVLLVVAADDGPMPQTREHLEILDLLGLTRGAVVVTKTDLVTHERVAQVTRDIHALLAGTGLNGAPVFPVSCTTGMGLDALREHLQSTAMQHTARADAGRFRLAIDRCFTLTGAGTVVTGTVYSGHVAVGDHLVLSPSGMEVRVRSLHAQNRPSPIGSAGQRCAINITGPGVEKKAIRRGDWLLDAALHLPSTRFDAIVRVTAGATEPLRHGMPVHVHLGAADITGRLALLQADTLAPGRSGFAQLLLDHSTASLHGDRFVVRDQSAQRTLGGGTILDNQPPTRRRRAPARLAYLTALTESDAGMSLRNALRAAPTGIDLTRYGALRNLEPHATAALAEQPGAVAANTTQGIVLFAQEHWQALERSVIEALAREHRRAPEQLGPDRERLRRLSCPATERSLFAALLASLAAQGRIATSGPLIHLPEHRVSLAPAEERLWKKSIRPLLGQDAFNPPRVRDVARALQLDEERVRRLLRQLAGMGEVHRIAHDHYFTHEAVEGLREILQGMGEEHGDVLAAPFRDRIGVGRKVAIQILEFFDGMGVSRRFGDAHRVFRDSLLATGGHAKAKHPGGSERCRH